MNPKIAAKWLIGIVVAVALGLAVASAASATTPDQTDSARQVARIDTSWD